MPFSIKANGHTYEADLLVFDKDGLMFEAQQFWIELADSRLRALCKHCTVEQQYAWAKLMGVTAKTTDEGKVVTTYVNPTGILAIAPPTEEIVILAAFLVDHCGMVWHAARNLAKEIFEISDADFSLKRAIKAQPGYEALMKRINDLGIPYGVATSDTVERTRDSMKLYNCWDNVRFVVTSADVPLGKPNPDMLLYISELEHLPTDRMVMIGDSYVDVAMAKAAGSIGIGVTVFDEMKEKMKPYATEILDSLEGIEINKL